MNAFDRLRALRPATRHTRHIRQRGGISYQRYMGNEANRSLTSAPRHAPAALVVRIPAFTESLRRGRAGAKSMHTGFGASASIARRYLGIELDVLDCPFNMAQRSEAARSAQPVAGRMERHAVGNSRRSKLRVGSGNTDPAEQRGSRAAA